MPERERHKFADLADCLSRFQLPTKTAVRLRPARAGSPLGSSESSIGGTLHWPAEEPWPTCDEHQSPYTAVLQLYKQDVPELAFPGNTDLFQLLWCPNEDSFGADLLTYEVRWRRAAEIAKPREQNPVSSVFDEDYFPRPCRLRLTRVREFPHCEELSEETKQAINASPELLSWLAAWNRRHPDDAIDEPLTAYQFWLSVADGSKIGGYVNWIQSPEVPECGCDRPMEHLLSIASAEFDVQTYHAWCPDEGREAFRGSYEERMPVQSPMGLLLGDMGMLYFFICRHCPDWPIRSVFQCS